MAYGDPLNSKADAYGRGSIDLLARVIYAENGSQGDEARRATGFVVKNQVDCNISEFKSRTTYEEAILYTGAYSCVTGNNFLKPVVTSQTWKDSLSLAEKIVGNPSSVTNPISNSKFFMTTGVFNNANNHKFENGFEYYKFPGSIWLKVTYKNDFSTKSPSVDAVFFNLEGY